MTRVQPSYGEPLPLWLTVPPTAPQRRWTVLLRAILVIPHLVVLAFLGIAAAVVTVIGWFGALVTGRLPAFAHQLLSGVIEWQGRVYAYGLLLTDRHPPYRMGPADHPVQVLVPPAQRLNRAAVLFRIVLVVPAQVVASAVQYGAMTVLLLVHWLITLVQGQPSPAFAGAYASVLRLQLRLSAYFAMLTPAYPWHGLFGDQALAPAPGWPAAPGAWRGGTAVAGPPSPGWPTAPVPGWPGAPTGQAWPTGGPSTGAAAGHPVPDVFTYGGAAHLWGYTADRRVCGVWRRDQPGFPPEWWPVERQDEAWRRFRELEPAAVEYRGPAPFELGFTIPVAPGPAAAREPGAGMPGGPAHGTVGGLPAAPQVVAGPSAASGPGPALVLESGSRVLLVLFIALGIVSWVAFRGIVTFPSLQRVRNGAARTELQQGYASLRSATVAFQSRVSQCSATGDLPCVTAADRHEAGSFTTFSDQLATVTVAGTAANRDLARLQAITVEVSSLFRQLGSVTTPAQYQQVASGSQLPILLGSFDTTYNQLQADLGASS